MSYSFTIIENTEEAIQKACTPYGNSSVTMGLDDITALLTGKLLFYSNGEYGTFVELDPNIGIFKVLRELTKECTDDGM